jgi:hypothetical protein
LPLCDRAVIMVMFQARSILRAIVTRLAAPRPFANIVA